MRVFVALAPCWFAAALTAACAHTAATADAPSGPRIFRCAGQFDTEVRQIRGFVGADRSVTYFQSWAYEAGRAFESLRKEKLPPRSGSDASFVYDVPSSLGGLKFTLPSEAYGLPADSGWDHSTYARFHAHLSYSSPTSPQDEVTIPLTCAMGKAQDYATAVYDEPGPGG